MSQSTKDTTAFLRKINLAVLEKYKGITGKYFDNDKGSFGEAYADTYDEGKGKELMQLTQEFLEL